MVNKLKMKKSRKAETSEHWYGNSELWLVGDEEGRFAELTSSSASCISRLSPMGFTISLSFTFALRQFTLRSTVWVKYCSHFGTSDWSGERCSRRFKIVKTIPSPDIRRTKDMYIPAITEMLHQFFSDLWRKKNSETGYKCTRGSFRFSQCIMQFSAIDVLCFFSLSSCLSITVSLLALLAKGSVLNLGRDRPIAVCLYYMQWRSIVKWTAAVV